jgi:hypothetical protein
MEGSVSGSGKGCGSENDFLEEDPSFVDNTWNFRHEKVHGDFPCTSKRSDRAVFEARGGSALKMASIAIGGIYEQARQIEINAPVQSGGERQRDR